MSGFSPEWLALREPADKAARSPRVLAACRQAFCGRDEITICDMGAGTGASVRALAPLLPRRQAWVLIDHDDRNLAAAKTALDGWTTADGHQIRIRTLQHDFARAPTPWPAETGCPSPCRSAPTTRSRPGRSPVASDASTSRRISSSADARASTSALLRCAYSATSAMATGHHTPTTELPMRAEQLGLEKRTQRLTPSFGRGDFFTADATMYPQDQESHNRRASSARTDAFPLPRARSSQATRWSAC